MIFKKIATYQRMRVNSPLGLEHVNIEQPVHKNVTIPTTSYFDWDDMRVEVEILTNQVIITKYNRIKK